MNSNDMQHTAVPDEPAKAGMKEWIGLAVLTLPVLLLSLDVSVLYLAIPHMAKDLQPDSTQLLWIMDMYGFMIAGFLVTMGTLGDRIGRRRLLLIGATVFAIASVMAAFSKSAEMLIAARALLGPGIDCPGLRLSRPKNGSPHNAVRTGIAWPEHE